ncbi:MAG: TIGR04086 family membrane protein [Clostridia bacterium]|nr:TIGR04086 family membrane protein [Clostridia bacterium]
MSYGATQHHRKKATSAEEGASLSKIFQSATIGVGASLLCAAVLLLVGALICQRSQDPNKMTLPLGLVSLYLSALLGGIVAVRHRGSSALLCGAVCGILLLVFFWIVSIFFGDSDAFSLPLSLFLRCFTAFFSILGAYLGLKRSKRSPHRKR